MTKINDGELPSDSEIIRLHSKKILELEAQVFKQKVKLTNLHAFLLFVTVLVILTLSGIAINIIEARSIIEKQLNVSNKTSTEKSCPSLASSKEK